jgi:hypothetical protein
VLAKADHRLADGVVGQQFGGAARVFGRNEVDFLQRPQGRNDRSSRFPMGVATTNKVPAMKGVEGIIPIIGGHV